METHSTCPLGSECEQVKDGKVYKCAWSVSLAGKDATGKDTNDTACAIAWLPLLMIEQRRAIDGVQAATESSRNENVKGLYDVAGALRSMPVLQEVKD